MKKNIYAIILIIFLIILICLSLSISYKIYTTSKLLKIKNSYSNLVSSIKVTKVLSNINVDQAKISKREVEIQDKITKYGKNSAGIPVLMYHFFMMLL